MGEANVRRFDESPVSVDPKSTGRSDRSQRPHPWRRGRHGPMRRRDARASINRVSTLGEYVENVSIVIADHDLRSFLAQTDRDDLRVGPKAHDPDGSRIRSCRIRNRNRHEFAGHASRPETSPIEGEHQWARGSESGRRSATRRAVLERIPKDTAEGARGRQLQNTRPAPHRFPTMDADLDARRDAELQRLHDRNSFRSEGRRARLQTIGADDPALRPRSAFQTRLPTFCIDARRPSVRARSEKCPHPRFRDTLVNDGIGVLEKAPCQPTTGGLGPACKHDQKRQLHDAWCTELVAASIEEHDRVTCFGVGPSRELEERMLSRHGATNEFLRQRFLKKPLRRQQSLVRTASRQSRKAIEFPLRRRPGSGGSENER
ncbi:hypothetical protein AKJ09_05694 [Labilithrix luteola]|uniref:Uncharacterized protein n=1 Tax=Labilithrix luteola TaxID=1391654 RepID=A0A0K1PZR8_9BACT|nr:hypothetical protein AKJ09_05694 [Labilithrix luteola]